MSNNMEIINTIQSVMPSESVFDVHDTTKGVQINVCWPLKNDEMRPNKMSKTILIRVTMEVINDLANVTDSQRQQAYKKLSGYLNELLSKFEPDHNTSRFAETPSVVWDITTSVIF